MFHLTDFLTFSFSVVATRLTLGENNVKKSYGMCQNGKNQDVLHATSEVCWQSLVVSRIPRAFLAEPDRFEEFY